ncbi:MAG: hypothetical protein AAF399_08620 [Bacteroidota bacterium]
MDSQLAQQLDRYLLGELPPKEREAFEAELDRNPELQTALDQAEGALEAARILRKAQIRQGLHQHVRQQKLTQRNLRWGLSLAALLLLGSALWWWLRQSTAEPAPLEITTAWEEGCDVLTKMTKPVEKGQASTITISPEAQQLQAYGLGCEDMPTSPELVAELIAKLEADIEQTTNPTYQGVRYYYLGLLYLKLGDEESAKAAFQQDRDFLLRNVNTILEQLN